MLRRSRVWPKPEQSIAPIVESIRKGLAAQAHAGGGLYEAWAKFAPPNLVSSGEVGVLSQGGVLTIKATSASAKFEIEVWLRSGGLAQLRDACSRTLRRVKVV